MGQTWPSSQTLMCWEWSDAHKMLTSGIMVQKVGEGVSHQPAFGRLTLTLKVGCMVSCTPPVGQSECKNSGSTSTKGNKQKVHIWSIWQAGCDATWISHKHTPGSDHCKRPSLLHKHGNMNLNILWDNVFSWNFWLNSFLMLCKSLLNTDFYEAWSSHILGWDWGHHLFVFRHHFILFQHDYLAFTMYGTYIGQTKFIVICMFNFVPTLNLLNFPAHQFFLIYSIYSFWKADRP